MPLAPAPPSFVKDIALGPLLGTFGILLLFGMTVVQAYQYFTTFNSEQGFIKVLVGIFFDCTLSSLIGSMQVGVILGLEFLHLALSIHYNYYYLVEHYGQPEYILRTLWSYWLACEVGFVVAWLVNMFYTRRIHVLSHNLALAIIIGVLGTIRPAFGTTASIFPLIHPGSAALYHWRWLFIVGLSVGLSVDVLVAFCVSYYLLKYRDTNIHSTRNIVKVLLWYTVNTTIILTLLATIELILLLGQPQTLNFVALFQVQSQMYANCFLTTLNARQNLRRTVTHVTRGTPMVTLKTTNVHVVSTDAVTGSNHASDGTKSEDVVNYLSDCENVMNSTEKVNVVE